MASLLEIDNITNLICKFRPYDVELAEGLMQGVDILGSQRHYGGLPKLHPRLQALWDLYIAYKIAQALPLVDIRIFPALNADTDPKFICSITDTRGEVWQCDYLRQIRGVGDKFRLMLSDVYRVDAIAPMMQSMKAEIWMGIVNNIPKDAGWQPSIRIDYR